MCRCVVLAVLVCLTTCGLLRILVDVLCWLCAAFQCAVTVRATVLPVQGGRFVRPSPRSAYTYTPSGASPAQLATPCFGPLGVGPDRDRAWHPREFGAVLGVSASLPLPAPPLPSSSRRYASQSFVAGIPASRLATCLTAHPTNRVVACRSVRHSPPRPLPDLPLRRVFLRSICARRCPIGSLNLARVESSA